METKLMKDILEVAKIHPDEIQYVEAHGTGTLVGDPIEINALEKAFCEGRKEPLLVGTIKSNIGHTEASSGTIDKIHIIETVIHFVYEVCGFYMNKYGYRDL